MDPFERGRLGQNGWMHPEGVGPGLIFGAGNKLRADGPYLDLYREFTDALTGAARVITIGYSFRDAHVNEALRRWTTTAAEGSLLRIGRTTEEVPDVVRSWDLTGIDLQVVPGRAKDTMISLMAPMPKLQAPPPSSEES